MIDTAIVIRVLDAMGYDRVRRGLKAFEHEPEGTFCNCFATDAFALDLEPWPTSQRSRSSAESCGRYPRWRKGQGLGIGTIADALCVSVQDAAKVFVVGYESYPDELFPIIIDWMDRYERKHFEVTR